MSESKRQKRVDEGGEGHSIKTGGDREKCLTSTICVIKRLPPELLDIIFKHVESPKDLLNCRNTCLAWAAILKSTHSYFKMTLPFVMPYLSRMELLECSSVSKSWNQTVDTCIQMAEEFGSDSRLENEQQIILTLNSSNMPSFINNEPRGQIVAANPIIFRRVEVVIPLPQTIVGIAGLPEPEPGDDAHVLDRSNLLKFLEVFGHLIRHFSLKITATDANDPKNLKIIRMCLKLLPNLRVFCIVAFSLNDLLDEDELNAEREALNNYLLSNPWPQLKYLKVLKYNQMDNRMELASLAKAYACNLAYLNFGFSTLLEFHPPLSNGFFCLQKIVYYVWDFFIGEDFAAFLRSSQCQLKHLTIVYGTLERISYVTTEHLKGWTIAANAASASLETLIIRPRVTTTCHSNFYITEMDQLRLPKLKVLDLTTFEYPSIEFLQSVCPALERLTLRPLLHKAGWNLLTHRERYSHLYAQFPFWNELPKIQSVDVEFRFNPNLPVVRKVYTRIGYEQIQAKRKAWKYKFEYVSRCREQAMAKRNAKK